MLSFIATVVLLSINQLLKDTNFNVLKHLIKIRLEFIKFSINKFINI